MRGSGRMSTAAKGVPSCCSVAAVARRSRRRAARGRPPEQPACGFSARTVATLQQLGTPFAAVDILPDPRIRQELSGLSNWPTIPQLFVDGELVGGCDIVTEMFASGELADVVGVEQPADAPPPAAAAAPAQGPPLQIQDPPK